MTPERPATVVYCGVSLDGFLARADGGIDWLDIPGEEGEDYGWGEFFPTIGAIVMGRATFEKLLSFDTWPYGDTPLIVLSTTLTAAPEHLTGRVEISSLAPPALLNHLAARGFRRVYVDGGRTVQSFLRQDLIDEMVVARLPVLIGSGIPLFGDLEADLAWEHLDTRIYPNGLIRTHYRRQR